MRALIQRVRSAAVSWESGEKRPIGRGLVVLIGITAADKDKDAQFLTDKILNLRLFPSEDGAKEFDKSVKDINGDVLIVSQFTLYADAQKGRRPDFSKAAPSDQARGLYAIFVETMRRQHPKITTGEFGTMMDVHIVNQGPVTLRLDSET
jgi:D-tyrosyl-tRNA(Tyr) deacylase